MILFDQFTQAFAEMGKLAEFPVIFSHWDGILSPAMDELLGGQDILSAVEGEAFESGCLLNLNIQCDSVTLNFEATELLRITHRTPSRVYFYSEGTCRILMLRHLQGDQETIRGLHSSSLHGRPKISPAFEGKNFSHLRESLELVDTAHGVMAILQPLKDTYEYASSEDFGLQFASFPALRWYPDVEMGMSALERVYTELASDASKDLDLVMEQISQLQAA